MRKMFYFSNVRGRYAGLAGNRSKDCGRAAKIATAKLRWRKSSAPQNLSGHPNFVPPNSGGEKFGGRKFMHAVASCAASFTPSSFLRPQGNGAADAGGLQDLCRKRAFIRRGFRWWRLHEVVTPELIAYCQEMLRLNLVVHGAADATLQTLRVLRA